MSYGRLISMLLGTAMLAGCAMTESTNLTPRRVARDPGNNYRFETSWHSIRRGVSTNVQAYVLIDATLYPMKPVPFTRERFEAYVPLPPGKVYIPYRYRFDFEYRNTTPIVQHDSDLSPSYRLIVPLDPAKPVQTTEPQK